MRERKCAGLEEIEGSSPKAQCAETPEIFNSGALTLRTPHVTDRQEALQDASIEETATNQVLQSQSKMSGGQKAEGETRGRDKSAVSWLQKARAPSSAPSTEGKEVQRTRPWRFGA